MNTTLTKKEINKILTDVIISNMESLFKNQLISLDEESKVVFLKMMKIECLYNINFLSKEISDKKNDYVLFLTKSSINENIEHFKERITKEALSLSFFKDDSEMEANMNSFHFIKDMLFLDENKLENVSNAFKINKYLDNQELNDLIKLCINENKSFQKFINKNSDLLCSLGCSSKIRNPFIRTLNKLRGLEKIISLSDLSGLNDQEFVSKTIENKYYLLFTSRNVREFDIVKKSLNKFIVASCDLYLNLENEDKKRVAHFLYANKKHTPKGIVAKFIPQFVEHWKTLEINKDTEALEEFSKIYNGDIKNKGKEAATILKLLNNLKGKEKYSRVKAYNYEDLSVLIDQQILLTTSSVDNIQISASVVSKKNEINFIISGDKDMVDNFDFDEYIYSIYDAVKDLSKENRWGRDDEYTRIINNTIRTLTLRKKINNKEQKMEEGRIKKKV